MEVITVSSDSEASVNEADITIKNTTLPCSTDWHNEDYNIDWNDDDVRPAINYSCESPRNEAPQRLNHEEEIEDFVTPLKFGEKKVAIEAVDDEDTVPYGLSGSDSETCSQSSNYKLGKPKHRQKLSQEEKEREKILKEQKKLEKEKLKEEKKLELQKQKALKAAFIENQRNLKPEENIKFLKVHIDNDIINSAFGGSIISLLQENNIQYVVESQRKHFTVTWSKKRTEKVMDDFGELIEHVEITEENILLYVLGWEKAVELIHKNELLSHVEVVKSVYNNKKLTLVVYGIGKYFNYQKNKRNHDMKALVNDRKKSKPKSGEKVYEEAAYVTKDEVEFAVTDLQLLGQHNCRFIETPEEFSSLILNVTKSLSQIDYKLEKQKRQNHDFDWVGSDSRQSVKVDKNGNGLLRLWQQQICQFNAVGLETAQAVVSQHNSPLALVSLYENTESTKEAELLLQNIQIRREAGILSTSRRVGPQLSKKMYKFFTSDDPDVEL